jgi:DNA polymerase
MFLGASRSGRWSGSGVQVHNLPRPVKDVEKKYDRAVEIIAQKDYAAAKKEFSPSVQFPDGSKFTIPSAIGMATSCIRSAFQAPEGKVFVVCDLGAIENRVLGWLAECGGILEVFERGECPYLSFASKMYHVPYESLYKLDEHGKHVAKDNEAKDKRQIGKPAVLGAGYGLGGGELHCDKCRHEYKESDSKFVCERQVNFKECGGDIVKGGLWGYAENMGVTMTREEAHLGVKVFRDSYQEIAGKKGLWTRLEKAAMSVIENGKPIRVGPLVFTRRSRENETVVLRIQLPSGRGLHYMNAKVRKAVKKGRDNKEYETREIIYDGIGHGVGKIQQGWGEVKTYGGKICENVVQAISRDVLVNGMMLADQMGAEIVMHVHDEIVVVSEDTPFSFSLADLQWCMTQIPDWAPGLPLAAEGYSGKIYKKG